MGRPTRDLAGRRFGRLVALRREGAVPSGKTAWRCVCDCGKEKVVMSAHLVSGATISCGCAKVFMRLDRTGRRYGSLVALSWLPTGEWLCRCDCGGERRVKGVLLGVSIRSCGCGG